MLAQDCAVIVYGTAQNCTSNRHLHFDAMTHSGEHFGKK